MVTVMKAICLDKGVVESETRKDAGALFGCDAGAERICRVERVCAARNGASAKRRLVANTSDANCTEKAKKGEGKYEWVKAAEVAKKRKAEGKSANVPFSGHSLGSGGTLTTAL